MRVGRDLSAETMRLGHDRLHFFQRELRRVGIVPFRKNASRCADFDDVGSVLDHLANFVLYAFNSVGDPFRTRVVFGREQVVVAMAARDSQSRSADYHPRSGNIARIHRVPQRDVAVPARTDIPHGCEPGFERQTRIPGANQRFTRNGDSNTRVAQACKVVRQMRVRINQARHDGCGAKIDPGRIRRSLGGGGGPDAQDPIAFYLDSLICKHVACLHVQQVSGINHDVFRARDRLSGHYTGQGKQPA